MRNSRNNPEIIQNISRINPKIIAAGIIIFDCTVRDPE
ncbi:hypothetical protein ES705_27287 [subsurface metagenome]